MAAGFPDRLPVNPARVGSPAWGSSPAVDLSFVRDLIDKPGPFATVVLDVSHDTEDADHADALRWSEARGELARLGADEPTLAALDTTLEESDPPVGRAGRVLVAAGGEVLLDRMQPEPPPLARVHWGSTPDLGSLLVADQEPVTALVVRVDDFGGEILVRTPGPDPDRTEDVSVRSRPVHKVRGGGWAHLNMQERVEETWRQNTAALADRLDALVGETAARVLVVAGDAPARSRLRDALGVRAAGLVAEVEHSAGATPEDLTDSVEIAVRDVVAADRRAVLEQFDQALGRPEGLAVQGVEPVLAALRAAAVETLLLDRDVRRDGTVWVSDSPTVLGSGPEQLRALGAEPAGELPVDDAVLRAAAASGAAFVPLDGHEAADGVGAVLRFPVPAGT
jgi:hypothetical protein